MSPEFRPSCHPNYVQGASGAGCEGRRLIVQIGLDMLEREEGSYKKGLTAPSGVYLIRVTHMSRSKPSPPEDAKAAALRRQGALHPHPEAVQDERFQAGDFFDVRDRVQVRYEMVRRHRVEGRPVTEVATSFGVSRQAFYVTEAAFQGQGLPGLLPRRRGPKRAHKCTEEVLNFVEQWRASAQVEGGETLGEAIERRFGIKINPRSIDRALARRKKKPRVQEESQA